MQPWVPRIYDYAMAHHQSHERINTGSARLMEMAAAKIQMHGHIRMRTTWFELLIACEAQTKTCLPSTRDHKQLRPYHSKSTTTCDHIAVFKRLVGLALKDTPHGGIRGHCQHLPKPVRRPNVQSKHLNIITAIAAIGPTICLDPRTNNTVQETILPTAAATGRDPQPT